MMDEKDRAEADARILIAVGGADRQVEGWSTTAYAFIQLFCVRNRGKRCTGTEIVDAAIDYGVIQPRSRRAWGGPMQRAARAGLLVRVGFTEDPHRPGNALALWEVK